jgi:hypothetical protein
MSDVKVNGQKHLALLASIAVNIFLVAFVLGRFSGPSLPPPPPPGFGDPGMMPHAQGDMHRHGPPQLMGLGTLLSPGELRDEDERMREDFDKVSSLRKDFAARLDEAPVTKEDALKHFADVDQVMDEVKKEAREKAAEKISAFSAEDRHQFAKSLLEQDGPPPRH